VKDQDRAVAGGEPAPRRVEMAPKNIFFAHPVVGEEAAGCLRVGAVLAGQRDALRKPGFHLLDQLAKATVQPAVAKPAARKLLLKPLTFHALHPLAADSVPDKESQTIPTTQEIASRAHLNVKMWVIERTCGGILRFPPDHRSPVCTAL